MSWPFDPVAVRNQLAVDSSEGWVARRDQLALAGVGNALFTVNMALKALLVGLPDVARHLAHRSLASPDVLQAMPHSYPNEHYAAYMRLAGEASALLAYGLLRWIVDDGFPHGELARAVDLRDAALDAYARFSRERCDTVELDAYLVTAILANENERGLAMFRARDRDGHAALSPQTAKSERKLAALIAERRLAGTAGDPAVRASVDRLIRSRVKHWLRSGGLFELAPWLIIREQLTGGQRPAADVMMDAYLFLPDVPRPR